jgi:hypothetical protein
MHRVGHMVLFPVEPRRLLVPEQLLSPGPLRVPPEQPRAVVAVAEQQPRPMAIPRPASGHRRAPQSRLLVHIRLAVPARAGVPGRIIPARPGTIASSHPRDRRGTDRDPRAL